MAEGRKKAGQGPSRTLVLVSTLVALLGGGSLVALPFVVGPLVRGKITEEARARGVEIAFSGVSFFWWSVSLEGVRFRLIGVPGLEGQVKSLDVSLSSWEPRHITATDARVDATGSVADMVLAIGEWTRAHPKAYEIPLTATHVAVSYRPSPTEAPWLTIDDGAFSDGGSGAIRFAAPHAVVASVDVGAIGASWTATAAAISMAFGVASPEEAPVKLVVRYAASPPTATATLAPTPLTKLSGPLAVPLIAPGVLASGTADLTFVHGLETGPITGTLAAQLDGWVPPHPVELDGFLFGKTTAFTSRLDVSADRKLVRLADSRVKAGAFALSGSGTIERHDEGYATIRMAMSGALPCAAVAESAAAAHVGSLLSRIVGQAARRIMDGSVAVSVSVVADSRHLDAAKIEPRVGVGCGLVPLFGLDAKRLESLPKDLRDLAKALPVPDVSFEVPGLGSYGTPGGTPGKTTLPSLPSSLPSLPALPSGFPLPLPGQAPPE